MRIQDFIPQNIRLQIQLVKRYLRDVQKGHLKHFASPSNVQRNYKYSISLTQKIKASYLYENKIKNIQTAYQNIEKTVIQPNEIFSFWRIIGAPNKKNGFVKGRNILHGKLVEDYGGGLCQLSGIMYHLSLLAGLKIMERHNHSFDIYTDETRYTPLGADATVVYGYKDLRLQNPYAFPIVFHFEITKSKLTAHLKSEGWLAKEKLIFQQKTLGNELQVETFNGKGKLVATSCYKNT